MERLFGTDGMRGIANQEPMTPEMAFKLGRVGAFLFSQGKGTKARIVIGKDTRISGDMLEASMIAGICSVGVDVLRVGVMPTPAVAFLTKDLSADAGVMISASHNPMEDNGIKYFSAQGFKLDDELEDRIENIIKNGDIDDYRPIGEEVGRIREVEDANKRYSDFVLSAIPANLNLKGLRLVVDCANGASYNLAPYLFQSLGAEVISIYDKPNGVNINVNCGSTNPETIQRSVLAHRADLGLAFDGDADRVILADERGDIVDGDQIMAICSNYLKDNDMLVNNTLITTVMSNIGLEIALSRLGIKMIRTKVGDRYVLEEMHKRGVILGGEQSGHIIFLNHSSTGDGIITSLQLLNCLVASGESLSKLASIMKKLPQLLVNVQVKDKGRWRKDKEVERAIAEAERKLEGRGRVLIRPSGTQPLIRIMVEGPDMRELEDLAENIAEAIRGNDE